MIDAKQVQAAIGARLQHWRQARLMSRAELADRLATSEGAIRRWESGAVEMPLALLVLAAVVLQVEAHTLLPSRREAIGMVRQ